MNRRVTILDRVGGLRPGQSFRCGVEAFRTEWMTSPVQGPEYARVLTDRRFRVFLLDGTYVFTRTEGA